jgi:hypothetical protein
VNARERKRERRARAEGTGEAQPDERGRVREEWESALFLGEKRDTAVA